MKTTDWGKTLILFLFMVSLFSCESKPVARQAMIFRTACSIQIYRGGGWFSFRKARLIESCFDALRALDAEVDVVDPDSRLNQKVKSASALGKQLVLSGQSQRLYEESMRYALFFDGAFDPTIGAVVRLWNIGSGEERVPSSEEIDEALQTVGVKRWLAGNIPKGGAIDFGASAKGFAAQWVKEKLKKAGVCSAMIRIGGNITVIGKHPQGRLWRIGVQDPDGAKGQSLLLLDLEDTSASTSGTYERNFTAEGVLYHHLLNPKTGYPASGGLVSVTVVSKDPFLTDVASTALFVLGKEEGEQWALKVKKLDALFIDEAGNLSITPNLEGRLHFLDPENPLPYRVIRPAFN